MPVCKGNTQPVPIPLNKIKLVRQIEKNHTSGQELREGKRVMPFAAISLHRQAADE